MGVFEIGLYWLQHIFKLGFLARGHAVVGEDGIFGGKGGLGGLLGVDLGGFLG